MKTVKAATWTILFLTLLCTVCLPTILVLNISYVFIEDMLTPVVPTTKAFDVWVPEGSTLLYDKDINGSYNEIELEKFKSMEKKFDYVLIAITHSDFAVDMYYFGSIAGVSLKSVNEIRGITNRGMIHETRVENGKLQILIGKYSIGAHIKYSVLGGMILTILPLCIIWWIFKKVYRRFLKPTNPWRFEGWLPKLNLG
ncbi:MAG: hypothetical protein WCO12_02250 [bacterium]